MQTLSHAKDLYWIIYVNIIVFLRVFRIIDVEGGLILDSLGRKIKSERLIKGLKQFELAKRAGISNTYLSDIETGRTTPSLRTLNRLAKALDLDVKRLM